MRSELTAKLALLAANGDSLADAARELGISRQRAQDVAKRNGIEFEKWQGTGKWTNQLRALDAAKVALSEAARAAWDLPPESGRHSEARRDCRSPLQDGTS